jgi:hypothetical protein
MQTPRQPTSGSSLTRIKVILSDQRSSHRCVRTRPGGRRFADRGGRLTVCVGGDTGCGWLLLSVRSGLRWEGPRLWRDAADVFDDALQVVHVLGDPAGHLGVVAAASLGGAHRHAGREQVLDDVVKPVPYRFRLSRRVSWLWFCRAWPSPAWPSDPCKKGRSARCVSVRESSGRAAVRTLPWCRGRVALDEQRPGHRRPDPMSGCLTCRIGRHGFHRTSRHRPGTEPNGLGRSPDVPDRGAPFIHGGADERCS